MPYFGPLIDGLEDGYEQLLAAVTTGTVPVAGATGCAVQRDPRQRRVDAHIYRNPATGADELVGLIGPMVRVYSPEGTERMSGGS